MYYFFCDKVFDCYRGYKRISLERMLLQEGFCITDLLDANGDDFESGELDR